MAPHAHLRESRGALIAATTPVNIQPTSAEAGIRLDDRIQFQWTPYAGAGTLVEQRLRVWSDAGGTVLVWDSLLRVVEAGVCGDGWMDIYAADLGLLASTTYYWDVLVRNSEPVSSFRSTITSFTTEAARVSSSTWRGSQ